MKPEDSLKVKLTEEDVIAIYRHWNNDSRKSIEAFINMCKERGWIKKNDEELGNIFKGGNEMKLDKQPKGQITEEEVRHLYRDMVYARSLGEESFVELYRDNGWIKKTELEEAKEKWDYEVEKEWPKGYNTLKDEACRMACLAESIFALYEKEIERLKGER